MDNSKIKVGIIGFGRMGGKYLDKFLKNGRYEVAYICDVNKEARDYAAKLSPSSTIFLFISIKSSLPETIPFLIINSLFPSG